MGIDLSENGHGYNDLKSHIGHKIVCVGYKYQIHFSPDDKENPVNVALECEDCGVVLVDFDRPELPEHPKVEPEERGNREVAEDICDNCVDIDCGTCPYNPANGLNR